MNRQGSISPIEASSRDGELDRFASRHQPDLVALEAEVLDSQAGVPGRTMLSLQTPKFCTRPASVAGSWR